MMEEIQHRMLEREKKNTKKPLEKRLCDSGKRGKKKTILGLLYVSDKAKE